MAETVLSREATYPPDDLFIMVISNMNSATTNDRPQLRGHLIEVALFSSD